MELVEILIGQLGVQEQQAKGGAGLLFQLAQEKLKNEQFSQIAQYVPGIGELLNAAPQGGGMMGALGDLASAMGAPASIGNLATLAAGFSKLGLNTSMINKFVPIILSYIQGKGGIGASQLLEQILKEFL
ncbi:DUF2780 domain-containing protein [Limnoraphis robusta]|jgi:hypothetical protein|uniref:DUF2780 domain-containing protein n=1 Tax=Limnoraphis robusta CS-951 TaxID=1637645 RepID=A0A0F5YBU3_9CYAN|nr:DUF2780 domain-containing protein [Limnoraphis robusta]KKD35700.1 hypothetical protein WN50_23855 [Limnoraphis robusta CS-951]